MPTIELLSPYRCTAEYKQRMQASGVFLINGSETEGFSHIQSEFLTADKLAENLYWMDDHSFDVLLDKLPDDMFRSLTRQDILTYQHLQRQFTPEPDGYPNRSTIRPITWPVNALIPQELESLQTQLKILNIDEIKVGTEMEFRFADEPVLGIQKHLKIKNKIMEEIDTAIQNANSENCVVLQAKKEAVQEFNAQEILMYDLVERNPKTRDILEPIFGTSRDGHGYYDGEGILELKLNPVSPEQQRQNRRIVLETLYEKSVQYGLIIEDEPSYHLSFSFWRDGKNLFDPSNDEFLTTGKHLLEGITRSVYDIIPTVISPYAMDSRIREDVKLHVNRDNFLRLASGRVELRPMTEGENQDTDVYLALILAGAVNGLKATDRSHMLSAQHIRKGHFHHAAEQYKVTSHVLGNSLIDAAGQLMPPETYIIEHADVLAYELGMITEQPKNIKMLSFLNSRSDYAPYLVEFFKKIQIDKENQTIVFPSTNDGVYEIATPKSYRHLLPDAMQKEFEQSDVENAQAREREIAVIKLTPKLATQAFQYMIDNDLFPQAIQNPDNIANRYQINLQSLQTSIQLLDVVDSFIIEPGYNTQDTSGFENSSEPLQSARLQRMINSAALQETSQQFQFSLHQSLVTKFPDTAVNSPLLTNAALFKNQQHHDPHP
jgi:hypothetical protein